MEIITQRLILRPFTLDIIDAASVRDTQKLESLGIRTDGEWPEKDLFEVLPYFRNLITKNGVNGFNSWVVVRRENFQLVGSAGFVGNPDEKGCVEIGFGIQKTQRRQGYCLEAATALVKWAFKQDPVRCISAQCENNNLASGKLLVKLGFAQTAANEALTSWILLRPAGSTAPSQQMLSAPLESPGD